MAVQEEISKYIAAQPEAKRQDLEVLNKSILKIAPKAKLWFLDGKDEKGKVVSNPNIGYGSYTITYTDGKTKEFYRIGLSANTGGISVYVMGLDDKTHLTKTYGKKIGKATVTGYCIKFKSLKDIDQEVLADAIKFGLKK